MLDLFTDTPTLIWALAAIFFVLAFTYSTVGLGGGSAYTACLTIMGFSSLSIPMISLSLNLVVSSVGSYQFLRRGHGNLKLILPFLISSMPMAYIGGALQLPREIFQWLLFGSLLFALARIYLWNQLSLQLDLKPRSKLFISLLAGSLLGLIAGIVGIGGGIYLVPLILILGLGTTKQAAACGAIFVWMNSLTGLISRIQHNYIDLIPYIPLFLAVTTGALLGAFLGSSRLRSTTVEKILGIVVAIAVILLGNTLIFQ